AGGWSGPAGRRPPERRAAGPALSRPVGSVPANSDLELGVGGGGLGGGGDRLAGRGGGRAPLLPRGRRGRGGRGGGGVGLGLLAGAVAGLAFGRWGRGGDGGGIGGRELDRRLAGISDGLDR